MDKTLVHQQYQLLSKTLNIMMNNPINYKLDMPKLTDILNKPFNKASVVNFGYVLNVNENEDLYSDFVSKMSVSIQDILNMYGNDFIVNRQYIEELISYFNYRYGDINHNIRDFIQTTIENNISKLRAKYASLIRNLSTIKKKETIHNSLGILKGENVAEAYSLNTIVNGFSSNSEIVRITQIDNFSYILNIITQKNKQLFVPYSMDEIDQIVDRVKNNMNTNEEKQMVSSERNIVKIYQSIEELESDNYTTVYIDTTIPNEFSDNVRYFKELLNKNTENTSRKKLYAYLTDEKFVQTIY